MRCIWSSDIADDLDLQNNHAMKISCAFILPIYLILIFFNKFVSWFVAATVLKEFTSESFDKFSLVNTRVDNLKQKHRSRRHVPMDMCTILPVPISNVTRNFCVYSDFKWNEVIYPDIKVTVQQKNDSQHYLLKDMNITLVYGYDIEMPYSSSIEGYLDDDRVYGKLQFEKNVFYLEPLQTFPSLQKYYDSKSIKADPKVAVMYRNIEHMYNERSRNWKKEDVGKAVNGHFLNLKTRNSSMPKANGSKGWLCSVLAVADSYFTGSSGSVRNAVARMVLHVTEADAVLRTVDWNEDGFPDNVGLKLHGILMLNSNYLFPNSAQLVQRIDGRQYLMTMGLLADDLKNYCLGIAFTSLSFNNRVLGVSYTAPTGGICEYYHPLGLAVNLVAISFVTEKGTHVPWPITVLSLIHELGHSFGANHDGKKCKGYIMSPFSVDGSMLSHYRFSTCSKKSVMAVLRKKSDCLVPVKESFCGNGLAEEDEECDCGSLAECLTLDPCCVPRGSRDGGCMVNRALGFECHPDQGHCCTDKCQFKDLSSIGLSCERIAQGCPCPDGEGGCECGLLGTCEGRRCVSRECAWLDLAECSCPRSGGRCSTCCKAVNGSCVPAHALASELKPALDIRRFAPQDPPPGLAKKLKLCGPQKCFNVWFRQWKENGPCVHNTLLGKCVSGRCVSLQPQPVNIFTRSSQTRKIDGAFVLFIGIIINIISLVY